MLGVFVFGCSDDGAKTDATSKTSTPAAAADYHPSGQRVELAGITFDPDATWIDNGPSGMRKADYGLAPVEGETDTASLTVFYFGPGSGGGIDANLQRWIGQMSMAEGGSPRQTTQEIAGMPTHLLEVHGTYNASMGGPMSGQSEPKEDYSMYAAVLETEQGNVFFKLTGPAATAAEMNGQFMGMLEGVGRAH